MKLEFTIVSKKIIYPLVWGGYYLLLFLEFN